MLFALLLSNPLPHPIFTFTPSHPAKLVAKQCYSPYKHPGTSVKHLFGTHRLISTFSCRSQEFSGYPSIPRLFLPPVFDHLQFATGENINMWLIVSDPDRPPGFEIVAEYRHTKVQFRKPPA